MDPKEKKRLDVNVATLSILKAYSLSSYMGRINNEANVVVRVTTNKAGIILLTLLI